MTRNIHLKTKLEPGQGFKDMQFAILMEPPLNQDVDSDEQLYMSVKSHGKAVLAVFDDNNPFKIKPDLEILTPEEFEKKWRGD